MDIDFYTNDNEGCLLITSFYDVLSNPFTVGDIISLNVSSPNTRKFAEYLEKFDGAKRDTIREITNEQFAKFDGTTLKIVSENKVITIDLSTGPNLVIEYYCEIVK